MTVHLRRLQWEERSLAADLIARAHKHIAPWVHILERIAPADRRARGYAYSVAEHEAVVASGGCAEAEEFDAVSTPKRISCMKWVLEQNLSILRSNEGILLGVDADTGRPVCFFMFVDPEEEPTCTWRFLMVPCVLGWRSFLRLVPLPTKFKAVLMRNVALHKDRGWRQLQLERVTVEPELQGCGLGRAMLAAANRLLDRQGAAGYLFTQNERTMRMYEQMGWKTLEQMDLFVDSDGFSFRNWFLWREPSPSSAESGGSQ